MKIKPYHLNYAAIAPLAKSSKTTMNRALEALSRPDFYVSSYSKLNRQLAHVKQDLAHLLGGVDPSRVAFTESTSAAFARLVTALPVASKSVIAVGKASFLSIRAALRGFDSAGVPVLEVGNELGEVTPVDLDAISADRVAFVAVEWVNWRSGFRNRIQPLATYCRETNIPLVLDAVQGLGATEIDFNLDDIGGLVCGGHKWLGGPEGTGFLYVSPWLQRKLRPTHLGYRSAMNTVDDVETPIVLRDDAGVLEVGTQNLCGLLGLGGAVSKLRRNRYSLRVAKIGQAVTQIIDILSKVQGIQFLTPLKAENRAGIVTFRLAEMPSTAVQKLLANAGIICGVRDGWVRLSPGPEASGPGFRKQFSAALTTLTSNMQLTKPQ